jgi:hypothetical protein
MLNSVIAMLAGRRNFTDEMPQCVKSEASIRGQLARQQLVGDDMVHESIIRDD